MKILIHVHALTGGGAERVAASWANGLAGRGHDVTVLTNLKQPQTYSTVPEVKLVQRDMPVAKGVLSRLMYRIAAPVKALRQYCRILRRDQPDAVVMVLYLNDFLMLLARWLTHSKAKVIMTDHNVYQLPEGIRMRRSQHRNKYFDNRFFDTVTTLTDVDTDLMLGKGYGNFKTLHNPLFLKPVETVPYKTKTVLSVGRLDAWHVKGFDLLVKAWAEVSPRHPDWRLKIVGAGSKETVEMLKSLAGAAAGTIDFAPYTADIATEYRDAAVYVLASRYEGWGLVAIEAMSQGCAVIAADYGGRQSEFIEDGVNGLLVKAGDSGLLAQAWERVLGDNDLRKRLQEQAPASVAKYSETETAAKLEQIINQTHR